MSTPNIELAQMYNRVYSAMPAEAIEELMNTHAEVIRKTLDAVIPCAEFVQPDSEVTLITGSAVPYRQFLALLGSHLIFKYIEEEFAAEMVSRAFIDSGVDAVLEIVGGGDASAN